MKSLILWFLLQFVCNTLAYKILVIYPLPIKSVNFLGQGVVRQLLKDGHEVTYIAADPLDIPQNKNFRQIDVSANRALLKDYATWNVGNLLKNKKVENEVKGVQDFCRIIAEMTFSNENVTKFLENTNEHFDAVVADLFESAVYAGLGVLYNTPMLWFFSMGAHWQVIRLIADPSNPTYDADYYGGNIPPFSFTQRVQELYSRARWMAYKKFYTLPAERGIYEKTFGPLLAKRGRILPDYEEVIYNASMIFGNEHNAVVNRPSAPQNFKYIGGIHIDDPVKPLPKNLQDIMDKSPQGVIYFSMGTFLQSKDLPMQFVRDLLEVLGEVKQTVIWKYEEDLKDVPKNVHIVKWASQHSILEHGLVDVREFKPMSFILEYLTMDMHFLGPKTNVPTVFAHPNCKFFISHGGLLSSIETIHFGKPIIGVPGMLDQITNVNKAVANGYAIKVNLDYNMPANLRVAIKTMLSDDKYEKKIKELSFIYHDRPMKLGDELNYWVRHVVQTRGAWHLRSPAINVPLYQRLYLDLVALVSGVIFILCLSLNVYRRKINNTEKNLAKKKRS